MCLILAIGYKFEDKSMQKIWLVLSKDSFVCVDNLKLIYKIADEYGINNDSITVFDDAKFDIDEVNDLSQTVSFFGERLIVIKNFDISEISEDNIQKLCNIISQSESTHFAIVLTYDDEKVINGKKYQPIMDIAREQGILHIVKEINNIYLAQTAQETAKKLGASLDKETAEFIVQNAGQDLSLIICETEKYAAACGYQKITKEIVNAVGVKTLEAKIFDIIDLICNKKPVKALTMLNILYDQGTDEIAVLAAMATAFIDMHRCKLAKKSGKTYRDVHNDFEKRSNVFRYKKAMSNAGKFSEKGLEEILTAMLKTDISLKSTPIEKRYLIDILVTDIIAKGMAG